MKTIFYKIQHRTNKNFAPTSRGCFWPRSWSPSGQVYSQAALRAAITRYNRLRDEADLVRYTIDNGTVLEEKLTSGEKASCSDFGLKHGKFYKIRGHYEGKGQERKYIYEEPPTREACVSCGFVRPLSSN